MYYLQTRNFSADNENRLSKTKRKPKEKKNSDESGAKDSEVTSEVKSKKKKANKKELEPQKSQQKVQEGENLDINSQKKISKQKKQVQQTQQSQNSQFLQPQKVAAQQLKISWRDRMTVRSVNSEKSLQVDEQPEEIEDEIQDEIEEEIVPLNERNFGSRVNIEPRQQEPQEPQEPQNVQLNKNQQKRQQNKVQQSEQEEKSVQNLRNSQNQPHKAQYPEKAEKPVQNLRNSQNQPRGPQYPEQEEKPVQNLRNSHNQLHKAPGPQYPEQEEKSVQNLRYSQNQQKPRSSYTGKQEKQQVQNTVQQPEKKQQKSVQNLQNSQKQEKSQNLPSKQMENQQIDLESDDYDIFGELGEDEFGDEDFDEDFLAKKISYKKQLGDNENDDDDDEDDEDDISDDKGISYQKRMITSEILLRNKTGQEVLENEFWPVRDVDPKLEFPNILDPKIVTAEGNLDEDKIKSFVAEKVAKKKEKEEKIKTRIPQWIKKGIAVDELPVREKAQSTDAELSWNSIENVNHSLISVLRTDLGITAPTEIQVIAFPKILSSSHIFIAAQTGTGKTLAYLIPLLHRLSDYEKRLSFRRRGQKPRAIILVPTRELVEQTENVLKICLKSKEFSHMKCFGIAGGLTNTKQEHTALTSGLDLLISTPERLMAHYDQRHFTMDDCVAVVMDEADTLLSTDTYFIHVAAFTHYAISKTPASVIDVIQEKKLQFIWVSATVSSAVADYVKKYFSNAVQVFGSRIHTSVDNLRQDFLYGTGGKWKERLLLDTLSKNKGKRTMIFCNTPNTSKFVYQFLKKKGYSVALLASDMLATKRAEDFRSFSLGKKNILVSTDLASRGIDTQVHVDHVLIYDFPKTTIDYLHRAGRTARAGKSGLLTAFVGKADQDLAQKIREAYKDGKSLAQISVKIPHNYEAIKQRQRAQKRRNVLPAVSPKYLNQNRKLKKPSEIKDIN